MLRIHIGHHFFGAGNIGDDLILAGFLSVIGAEPALRLTCCCPHDITSQRRRFPAIEWLDYTPASRRDAIAGADGWLGLGGSPFQSDDSDWFTEHLLQEQALCGEHRVPMWFLGVGVNNEEVFERAAVRGLIDGARGIWARDAGSLRLLRRHASTSANLALGSDLAHCYLETHRPRPVEGTMGLCLHLTAALAGQIAAFESSLESMSQWDLQWLVQEVRHLPYSETATLASLSPRWQAALRPRVPNYASADVAELLSSWPGCAAALSARYHATLVHAWSGARVGVIAINDKLRSVAEDLDLPLFETMASLAFPSAEARLRRVPETVLLDRAARARASVGEWLAAVRADRAGATEVAGRMRGSDERAPGHVLMICGDSLGDMVLRAPLCRALLDAGHRLTVAARTHTLPLLPYIDGRIEPLAIDFDPYRAGPMPSYRDAIAQFIARVADIAPDTVLSTSFNRTIADDAALASAATARRVGVGPGLDAVVDLDAIFPGRAWPVALASRFSTVVPVERDWHEAAKHAALLSGAFGIDVVPYVPQLRMADDELERARSVLTSFGFEPGYFAVCCPVGGANVQIKAVPDALTQAVLRDLATHAGLPTLLVGIESERDRLQALAEACRACGADVRVWIGQSAQVGTLLGLIALARFYFGGDTGPMHMAAALGVPVAVVMGGGTYPRFLPVAARRFVAVHLMDCFGCGWGCAFERTVCLESISADAVIAGVRSLLR